MDELEALVAQVPDEILDYIEELETRVEKAEAALAPEGDSKDDLTDLPKEFVERLQKAEKALEEERIAKADSEWISKARKFDGLVEDPEDFGRKMRAVAEIDSELADSIAATLTAAGAQVAKSALFTEVGHGTPALGSVEEKIASIAKSLIEANPAKSQAEAEAEAWELNPDLYEQHVAERQQALRGGN